MKYLPDKSILNWKQKGVKSDNLYDEISKRLDHWADLVLVYETNSFTTPTPEKARVYHFDENTIKVSQFDKTHLGVFAADVHIGIYSKDIGAARKVLEDIIGGVVQE